MSVIEIRPVQRDQFKMVIGVVGQSGDGKTRSALELGLGLAGGDPKRIGFLDTENGRGAQYSDLFPERFLIGNLEAPYSPERYIAAMQQFAEESIDVLVVDSATHVWEGIGGCEEIAKNAKKADGTARKSADWLLAKREHKRFVNTLLYLPMHVILCIRAREKSDFRNPEKPVSMGVQPVCEKNLLYEMSLSIQLSDRGRKRKNLKLSDEFERLIGSDGYLTQQNGADLRNWCGGKDPLELARNSLRLAASKGTDELKLAWVSIGSANQKALSSFKDTLKDLATASDSNLTGSVDESSPEIPWGP